LINSRVTGHLHNGQPSVFLSAQAALPSAAGGWQKHLAALPGAIGCPIILNIAKPFVVSSAAAAAPSQHQFTQG
jgi:hypothetical protein